MKWPKRIKELPTVPTFVIVEIISVTYPDPYEDSKAGLNITDHHTSIITFDTEEEWKAEIAKRVLSNQTSYTKKEFKAYKMIPAEVTTTINVDIKEWQN